MSRENITILILGILTFIFTASLDIYIIFYLQAIDIMEGYILVLANILTIGVIYTIFMELTKKQTINNSDRNLYK